MTNLLVGTNFRKLGLGVVCVLMKREYVTLLINFIIKVYNAKIVVLIDE